ncbi:SCP2 sterol-binding domain-containing protein [Streptomyces lunaelactis]|uniref:SCP2 sterol-binding domain-containing protein n=1 Tax=Streptomyces lunaelactis TaxID=1535768 RepID=UPI0015853BB5|nr:SCP2 sterol-binding domain-containing protein [Streptomyces lunaelactis]NUK06621.1 SCP2 sterol-binding domain-containing protein [Streptomyces lunaelactis]NUK21458.1 SCP2 sterol-binding domain-containing protein [Streptomyces lunaelactis]NUK33462.1 SCP2 sterol-binding domain-containing protein [Streptomyces lunaelactis]NUK39916.1 SCP2 sterol-binding domain-containing protein [Streptomyces lunaelactis]NUK56278.1 SCP2 sterol-binding domain-containing protein [Streptomyces lunaelactis]
MTRPPDARHLQLRHLAEAGAAARGSRSPDDDVDRLLGLVFEWFRSCFSPERACGRSGTFEYAVNTPLGVRHRYIVVEGGSCVAVTAVDRPADAVIGVDIDDLLALAIGELKGTDAFVNGRLKISGDVFFAMNWIEWFGSRSTPPADD